MRGLPGDLKTNVVTIGICSGKPDERRPTFWEIYFSLFGGTRPAPPMVDTQESDLADSPQAETATG